MMLVQKPTAFPLPTHRRHPSSPAAVYVQPTQTPGLLSLSKPLAAQQQRSPRVKLSTTRRPQRSTPSQAEGSDPFIAPAPTPTPPPKPRQPRQRRPQQQQQPIPIAAPTTQRSQQTARSVPLPHHKPAKRTAAPNAAPLLPAFDFPICDDLSDSEAPPTPTRSRNPRRPPNSTTQSPQPKPNPPNKRARNHKRAPSDSGMVFNMSSDEESSPLNSSNSNANPTDNIDILFRNLALARRGMRTPPPHPAAREEMYEALARREVAAYGGSSVPPRQPPAHGHGYFASSSFQNSPSPDDLPDPLFV
ncbi:hypothetical protein H0H87_003793 [Tephrocybe sp. NHM501043]|nr:hypothetical protein H0H87_003793 [Tephrocybe sp. NHM501043]